MNSQRRQLIIMGAVGAILVAVVAFQLLRKGPPLPSAMKGEKPAASAKAGSTPPAATAKTAPAAAKAAPAPAAAAGAGSAPPAATEIKKTDINIDELLAGIKEVDFDYEKERTPRDSLMPLVGTLAKTREGGETKEQPQVAGTATAIRVMNKVVSGILWDQRRPLAIVDNEVIYPGFEYPDGTQVESIERDRVVFKVGESLIQVELKEL